MMAQLQILKQRKPPSFHQSNLNIFNISLPEGKIQINPFALNVVITKHHIMLLENINTNKTIKVTNQNIVYIF